jgi:RND family efflux transporter MFP subunit
MSDALKNSAVHAEEHESAPEQKPISTRAAIAGAAAFTVVAATLAGVGILHRNTAKAALRERTEEQAAPTVIAAAARLGAPLSSFTLPGNVTAFTDAPIYARTSGYLARWHYDIGARVKKGALLAEISAPEVDRQIQQAEADLATAQANAANARSLADRYSGLVQSNAVSRQDTDTYVSQAAATAAAVRSAQANLQRLRELQSFEKIYAPFDGVITARTVDTGQLIDSGAGKELFHLQAIQTLRVYANLPEVYAGGAKNGSKVDLTFAEHPGKTYQGTLVRSAQAIDPASRTLLVELDVDNRSGELLPGALAQVHFRTPNVAQSFVIPVPALIFRREGLRVGTVISRGNETIAHLVPVTIGEDDGATVQVVTGIGPNDQIIQDPPDSLVDGQRITVVHPQQNAGGK